MANKTGKGGFNERPLDRNRGNVPKGLREKYNSFRAMVLDWSDDSSKFKVWADRNPGEAFKLAGSLMPKEITDGDGNQLQGVIMYLPTKQ